MFPETAAHAESQSLNGDGTIDYEEFMRAVETMAEDGGLIDLALRESSDDLRGGVAKVGFGGGAARQHESHVF